MKVHIMGKGMISFLGLNAPIRNIELTEKQIRAIVPITTLKMYDAATNVIITRLNVDNFFDVEEPVKVPTPVKKKETKKKQEPTPVEQVAEPVPVVEEVVEAPAVEEPVEEIPVEVNEEAELTSDETDIPAAEDVEESGDEVEPAEETEFVPKKKNKKRR